MKIYQPIAGLCLTALLSACGGGGDTATSSPTPSVLTGVFLDSPVSGISYATATQSGKTNAKGEFSYVAGENITFSIGSIQLPAVAAGATVTPLHIAKTTDVNNQVVSNILVLLQSLDEDGNPANGITISATALAQAITNFNFDVSPAAFAAHADVIKLVTNSGSVNKKMVPVANAIAHFQGTTVPTAPATGTPTPPVTAGFAGTYQCSFSGTDSGTFKFVMSTATGSVSSCSGTSVYSGPFLCSGQINSTGSLNTAFTSTGAAGVGKVSATGVTGSWAGTGTGGSFSCSRI